ncbi:hypothetical protein B4088_2991 [Bacillus cereus]|uniref:Uncharacterized protein n=1 Tax=Bacillus cereus TaxID=1396 RepID=A0A164NPI6_BACCE|nr:hypothetical protein B4088_2991 [Bacillus cereus]
MNFLLVLSDITLQALHKHLIKTFKEKNVLAMAIMNTV